MVYSGSLARFYICACNFIITSSRFTGNNLVPIRDEMISQLIDRQKIYSNYELIITPPPPLLVTMMTCLMGGALTGGSIIH